MNVRQLSCGQRRSELNGEPPPGWSCGRLICSCTSEALTITMILSFPELSKSYASKPVRVVVLERVAVGFFAHFEELLLARQRGAIRLDHLRTFTCFFVLIQRQIRFLLVSFGLLIHVLYNKQHSTGGDPDVERELGVQLPRAREAHNRPARHVFGYVRNGRCRVHQSFRQQCWP